jgi:protein-S-isoprenylcysteine O-methyltransferase Ste14
MLLLKNLLFTVVAPGTVAVLLPLLIAGDDPPATGAALAFASVLFGLGASIYAWCVWDFASFGRGTPAPIDAPKRLVIRGLYRFTRNPMYLGVLTVILGWAAFFGAARLVLYAVFVCACFHAFIRIYEEPHLAREFGDEYAAYTAKVGRWLPRPPQKPAARQGDAAERSIHEAADRNTK